MWMMAGAAALSAAKGLSQRSSQRKYNLKVQKANNLQSAADQKIINTQSQQIQQQTAQARRGLAIKSGAQAADNEARSAASGGLGGSVDRTASVLELAADRMDQEIQVNTRNQLFQQELNKVGAVNRAASANNALTPPPDMLDIILGSAGSAMSAYR